MQLNMETDIYILYFSFFSNTLGIDDDCKIITCGGNEYIFIFTRDCHVLGGSAISGVVEVHISH